MPSAPAIENTDRVVIIEEWEITIRYGEYWEYLVNVCFNNYSDLPNNIDGIYNFTLPSNLALQRQIQHDNGTTNGTPVDENRMDFAIPINSRNIAAHSEERIRIQFRSNDLTQGDNGLKRINFSLCKRIGREPDQLSFSLYYLDYFRQIQEIPSAGKYIDYNHNKHSKVITFTFRQPCEHIKLTYRLGPKKSTIIGIYKIINWLGSLRK